MGASRDVTFASVVEFGLLLTFAALAVATGDLSLSGMFGAPLAATAGTLAAPLMLLALGLFALMLAECARVPVDDPSTHLELTMVHEVMVLDHGGPDLAMILYCGRAQARALQRAGGGAGRAARLVDGAGVARGVGGGTGGERRRRRRRRIGHGAPAHGEGAALRLRQRGARRFRADPAAALRRPCRPPRTCSCCSS